MSKDSSSETATEPVTKTKAKDNLVRLTTEKLEGRDPVTDKGAAGVLAEITEAHSTWKKAIEAKGRVSQDCKQRIESENSAFKEAIEAPLKPNAARGAVMAKLENVENRWQELSDAKAHNIEERKNAKADVETALTRLDTAIGKAGQLTLPLGSTGTGVA